MNNIFAEMAEEPARSLNNLNNRKLKKNGQNEIRVVSKLKRNL